MALDGAEAGENDGGEHDEQGAEQRAQAHQREEQKEEKRNRGPVPHSGADSGRRVRCCFELVLIRSEPDC